MKDGYYINKYHNSLIKVYGGKFQGLTGIVGFGHSDILSEGFWVREYKFNEYLKLL